MTFQTKSPAVTTEDVLQLYTIPVTVLNFKVIQGR